MKIMTVIGTRPEIIRLSRIIPKLDNLLGKNHILVNTGQNYDKNLSEIFFKELKIRQPDIYMNARGSFGKQIGIIMEKSEEILKEHKPDKVLILGDTNTDMSAYVAERLLIPVYHMEAGNRCYDKRVPEEVNRRMIDHISSYNFPYVPNSADNLYREGLDKTKIIISGNPIYEVLKYYENLINQSDILNRLNLKRKQYFLITCHRQETVDYKERLEQVIEGLQLLVKEYQLPIICSIHPRTEEKLRKYGLIIDNEINNKYIKYLNPMGFFDFVKLQKNAKAILSDSGTVCEEACILKIPHIITRDSTERPETVQVGASMISKVNAKNILNCTKIMLNSNYNWDMPIGYTDKNVSEKIIKYLMEEL